MHQRRSLRPVLLVALLLALPLAGCSGSDDGDAAPAAATATAGAAAPVLVSPAEAGPLLAQDGVIVIDVRTAEEFAAGHLEGARLLDVSNGDLAAALPSLDPAATYLVYCRSGNRSAAATALMAAAGFGSVYELDGGVLAWEAAGMVLTA